MSVERLKVLAQRISLMTPEQHNDVMKIVSQADKEWSGAHPNTNTNANDSVVLVDMCVLPAEIVAELESLVQLASTQMQFEANSMSELSDATNVTGEASKRWDAKIDSKVVFDRAEELVRRHLYRPEPPGRDAGGAGRKRNSKKNFLCTTKKIDVYEPQMNVLDEEPVPSAAAPPSSKDAA